MVVHNASWVMLMSHWSYMVYYTLNIEYNFKINIWTQLFFLLKFKTIIQQSLSQWVWKMPH